MDMPLLSPTMKKGNIIAWHKKEGDTIEVGDVILDIDTDKATMEVEATHAGILEKILIPAGTHDVLVKTAIAILRQSGDSDSDILRVIDELTSGESSQSDVTKTQGGTITDSTEEACTRDSDNRSRDRIGISPLARKIANEHGIDISAISGSGPSSRIVRVDVEKALNIKPPRHAHDESPQYVDEVPSQLRRVIAEKLTESKQTTPHFYLNVSADVTNLVKMRSEINDGNNAGTKITINDFIVKAAALALADNPLVNVAWNDGKIRKFQSADIAVAVSIDDGLITPIVRHADRKSITEISMEIKDLVQLAKDRKLALHQLTGGGITISNLGMYGIDSFLAIVNLHQGSILSIGQIRKIPAYNESNELVAVQELSIGYSVDHRVIDGAVAAKFLSSLVTYLQKPTTLLLG
jgi:pyruvate dehydrogenase E2 component (dihydrolipoamide acetyltransferase)